MGLGLEPLSTASLVDLPLFPTNPFFIAWGGFHGADGGAAGGVWMLCPAPVLWDELWDELSPEEPLGRVGPLVCPWPSGRWPKITR